MRRRALSGLGAIVLLCSCSAAIEHGATPTPADATLFIPDSAHLLSQAAADFDTDGKLEYAILASFGGGPQQLGYDWLQLFVVEPDCGPDCAIAFQSEALAGDRAEALSLLDINADGHVEVLSVQAMGASGETLYVLACQDQTFAFLRPQGGQFDGLDRFGDNGVRIKDLDGDGALEILAHYGPVASQFDVYRWDGSMYVYVETRLEQ
jgi:hypothetical protein